MISDFDIARKNGRGKVLAKCIIGMALHRGCEQERKGGRCSVYNPFWTNMKFVNMCETERTDFTQLILPCGTGLQNMTVTTKINICLQRLLTDEIEFKER